MKRLLVTGSSGYLGSVLVQHYRERGVRVLGVDLREPAGPAPDQFVTADICNPGLSDLFRRLAPDSVIHAAYLLDPNADEATAHRVNVSGTENVLHAVAAVRPERLLVVSSATAYGAWPDNPRPLYEDRPLRSRGGFRYAADKVVIERLAAGFADRHKDIAVSCVRPAIIGGPRMDNYLKRVIFEMPFLVKLDGFDQLLQFVHEEDVAGAIEAILASDGRGAYNIAPPDAITLSAIAAATRRRAIPVPFWIARMCHGLTGLFRLPIAETHRNFLYFVRYPWVVSPDRLIRETGYAFRFNSEETMHAILGIGGDGAKKRPGAWFGESR